MIHKFSSHLSAQAGKYTIQNKHSHLARDPANEFQGPSFPLSQSQDCSLLSRSSRCKILEGVLPPLSRSVCAVRVLVSRYTVMT